MQEAQSSIAVLDLFPPHFVFKKKEIYSVRAQRQPDAQLSGLFLTVLGWNRCAGRNISATDFHRNPEMGLYERDERKLS